MSIANFKVGDYVIDSDQIYSIFKIDENEDRLFYKPVKKKTATELICSLPLKNVSMVGLRPLLTKKQVDSTFAKIKDKQKSQQTLDLKRAREILYKNNLKKTISVVKNLWFQKQQDPTSFVKSLQELLDEAIGHLSNEIAFVTKSDSSKVRVHILRLLAESLS